MHRKVLSCRDEVAALRDCIIHSGAVGTQGSFLAQLHRWHFATMLGRHPLGACEARFENTLQTDELALAVGLHAGPCAVRALCAASVAMCGVADAVWPVAKERCPGYNIYICGGVSQDGQSAQMQK